MERQLTITVKSILVTGLVLLALVVAYLLGQTGAAPPSAQAADTGDAADTADIRPVAARPTLRMVGSGDASVVPDQVAFDLSVRATRADLDTALAKANATMQRVLTALQKHGVARDDVETTGLSMYPVYSYPPYSEPVLRGYRVTQRAAVLVKQLKAAGGAVSAAVATGGNAVRVSDIRLRIGHPEEALAKARRAAVAEATAKAEEYADAAGQGLGQVLVLRELGATPRSRVQRLPNLALTYHARDAAAKLSPLPIRTGRSAMSVRVEVVWELGDG